MDLRPAGHEVLADQPHLLQLDVGRVVGFLAVGAELTDQTLPTLLADLESRGMLEESLVVWMGEFGRTPRINQNSGRDHFPTAWSTALAGCKIQGGQAIGSTTEDGMTVKSRPVKVQDFMATVCQALDIDTSKQNNSNVGRPIRIADPEANAISEILK